ncbi:MAG: hypothetical protein ABFS32_01410 [Bacteroidota bacterium]
MIQFVNILLLLALAYYGFRITRNEPLGNFYLPGLLFKVLAGFSVGLIYSYYYTNGDTWVMYAEGIKLKTAAISSVDSFINIYFKSDYTSISQFAYPIQPRAAFMAKILGLLAFITNNNYWLSSIYLSIFSFWGFWLLATNLYSFTGSKWSAVIPTLFFPSIIFWTSGILKESVAIGAMAGVMSMVLKGYLKNRLSWEQWLVVIIGLLLLAQLKYYYAAILVVAVISLFGARILLSVRSKWHWELLTVVIIFIVTMSAASQIHPNLWPSRFLTVIVDNYYQYVQLSEVSNVVVFKDLAPTVPSVLIHSPKALFAGLFFPLWMSSFNILRLMVIIENGLLLIASIYGIRYFILPEVRDYRLLLFVSLLFIIVAAILLTFSAPNFGTLVRYKTGYLLVFVSILSAAISSRLRTS